MINSIFLDAHNRAYYLGYGQQSKGVGSICYPHMNQGPQSRGDAMCFRRNSNKYLVEGRLEDVLALIQVLALDKDSHRSETGLKSELPDRPTSSISWTQLAKEHQEFFRVVDGRKYPVSLVVRHVSDEVGEKRPPLSPEHTQALLNAAIELHDRQIRRSQRWTVLIPIWLAVIGGFFTVLKALFVH